MYSILIVFVDSDFEHLYNLRKDMSIDDLAGELCEKPFVVVWDSDGDECILRTDTIDNVKRLKEE